MMGAGRAGFYSAQAAAAQLLLDLVTVHIVAAFALRKVRSGWTGSAIRVRRSSDDAEQDIGFTSGNLLDVSALLTFVGSGDGLVVTWYDQSGNGRHLTQATKALQCKIVISGSVVAYSNTNARPAIQFYNNEATTFLGNTNFDLGSTTNAAMHAIASHGTGVNGAARFCSFMGSGETNDYSSTNSFLFAYFDGGTTANLYINGTISNVGTPSTGPFQLSMVCAGTTATAYCDASAGSAGSVSPTFANPGTIYLGTETANVNSNEQWSGTMAELIITSGTESSSDRSTLRGSQKTYAGTA